MDDDRILLTLRRIAEPVDPPAEFLDRMYEDLADELGFRGGAATRPAKTRRFAGGVPSYRAVIWVAAAILLALAIVGGAVLIGAQLERRLTPTSSGTCGTGRTVIEPIAIGESVPVPEIARSMRAPQGTRIAIALEDDLDTDRGTIIVAGQDAGSARVVATFTGSEIMPLGGVGILGWTPGGDGLLVYAGSDSMLTEDGICGNLFLLQADSSAVQRLSDNGPGQAIDHAVMAPSGTSVAFIQEGALHIVNLAGGDETIPVEECLDGPHRLNWAPAERRIVVACPGGIAIIDRDASTASYVRSTGGPFVDAVWTLNGEAIVAAMATDLLPIVIIDIDPETGTQRARDGGDYATTWIHHAPTLSPDGRWLLIQANEDGPEGLPTYLIDTGTGATTKLPWPVLGDSWSFNTLHTPSVAWLEGNDRVLSEGAGTLYEINLRDVTRTAVGLLLAKGDRPSTDWAVFPLPP